jgi:ABC-type antimicrobial peptide transport system permease subunit
MDLEETVKSYGFQLLFMAFFTAISVGITIGVFWIMNQTQFFSVDINLFLDKFALPYFVASFALQVFNRGFAYVAARA